MASYYVWLKAAHVAFMVTWFAGLFYLPRLFIYHAEAADERSRERFVLMEKRLFAITTIGAALTIVLGFLVLSANPPVAGQGWFQLKVALVVGLFVFHMSCRTWMRKLKDGYQTSDTKPLRWYNEIPVFFLLTIIVLAEAKPF